MESKTNKKIGGNMSNQTYDLIKNIALVIAPVTTLVIALLGSFKVIDSDTAVSISSAIDTFLGAIVVVSKQIYDNKKATKKTTKNNAK